ncbi:hypothetical protein [Poriferisphaera sp. WC338]|uniref:hypothetical protein n=1 Tax=Poriferisphaera sp. WC338 TaxID=3425129 RepID=UPI003D816B8A
MLIFSNILLIVFLLAMVYIWGIQGWFSALIHLCCTIAAGTIAFAIWEPLTLNLLIGLKPSIAWSLGLLVPFGVLLIVFRMVIDKLIRKNMQLQQFIGFAGGAACGLASGLLTAGIVVIGLGLLPLGQTMGGYQPFARSGGGGVIEGEGKLWVPVDNIANKFFATLSSGAFAPSFSDVSLSSHRPDLARQVSINRLAKDENASTVATPEELMVSSVYERETPVLEVPPSVGLLLGDAFKNEGNRLLVVDTVWESNDTVGTFDGDQTFRCSGTQVRLVTKKKNGTGEMVKLTAPIAFSKPDGEMRVFKSLDSNLVQAWGSDVRNTVGWVFVVPADETPEFLFVKQLRLNLPKAAAYVQDVNEVLAALGVPSEADQQAASDDAAEGSTNVGDRTGPRGNVTGKFAEQTNKLPRVVSKNYASGLDVTSDGAIRSGSARVTQRVGSVSKRIRIDRLYVPSHQSMIRIEMERDVAQSLLGRAHASAVALGAVYVTDDKGGDGMPAVGYVLSKKGGEQIINIKRIRSAKNLPLTDMERGDKLYVYFKVNRNRTIEKLHIGGTTEQEINLKIN